MKEGRRYALNDMQSTNCNRMHSKTYTESRYACLQGISSTFFHYFFAMYADMHNLMKYMTGWFPVNFIRETAPLILNMATQCHTTESGTTECRTTLILSGKQRAPIKEAN